MAVSIVMGSTLSDDTSCYLFGVTALRTSAVLASPSISVLMVLLVRPVPDWTSDSFLASSQALELVVVGLAQLTCDIGRQLEVQCG